MSQEKSAAWTLPAQLRTDDPTGAAERLSTYFHLHGADGEPAYTGAKFEAFAGGGDRAAVRDRFTAEDIVAVSLLSVNVKPPAALRILGVQASVLTALLADIPADLDLYDTTAAVHIAAQSPADHLWRALRAAGVGPVTTSKLLARKRPRLLPVIDSVVKATLNHPPRASFWTMLNHQLRVDDSRLVTLLEAARAEAGLEDSVSVIRCFDVVVWLVGRATGTSTTRRRFG